MASPPEETVGVKFTVFTLAFPGYTAEGAVEAAARLGFDGVDIRAREDGHIYVDTPSERRRRLVELAESLGVEIASVYSYVGRELASPDPGERRRGLELLSALLDLAVDLGGEYVRVFAGTRERTEENFRRLVESLKLACRGAEDRGVKIGVETHGELAYSGATCRRLLEEVGSSALSIVYDVAGVYREGLDPLSELKSLGVRDVIAVQFHDFKREGGAWKPVLLGEGEVPHKPVVEYLVGAGYSSFAVCEYEKWWHPELPDPIEALPRELAYVKALFGGARP
jgi:sugar phosphate isomerase/epimerase